MSSKRKFIDIWVYGYPCNIHFKLPIAEKLPDFNYGCKTRTKLVREQLECKR